METDHLCIGGGPAGVFAALTAAANGKRCMILEHNKQLGRKLRITGKGRCNLTNNCDRDTPVYAAGCDGLFRGLGRAAENRAWKPGISGERPGGGYCPGAAKGSPAGRHPGGTRRCGASDPGTGQMPGCPHRRRQRVPGWDNAPRHRRTFLPQDRLRRHRLSSGRRGRSHHRAAYALADPVGHQRELVPGCHGAFPAERDPAAVPGRKMRL